ncbi:MAG TPA: hypothetical protein VGR35_06560 [Tepidisphaeraceae bacterium]|nr:hypothetical protein [Tepidisphaeraceae bacterium]
MPHPLSGRRCRRRGVAMLLVLGVVIMAAVLGYAMLSSAAITKQASSNAAAAVSAQGIAESGVHIALYYLQNPDKAPGYPATYPNTEQYDRDRRFWTGTGGQFIDLGSPSIGQVKVAVTRVSEANRWEYQIESVGRAPGGALERCVLARSRVNAEYRFDHAVLTSYDVNYGQYMRIEGDAYSNGGLSIRSGGAVVGRGIRRKATLTSVLPTLGWQAPPALPRVIPKFDEIRSYRTYELPAGTFNEATALTQTQLGRGGLLGLGGSAQLFEATPTNPAGVYYAPGDLTINSDVEFRGTLIVYGNLQIVGDNVRIRAAPGFPALVVGGNVKFGGVLTLAPKARVEGLMYTAGRLDASGLLPTLEVEGAMLVGGTSPLFPSLLDSYVRVWHNRALASIPDFSDVGRTAISVKTLQWQAQ